MAEAAAAEQKAEEEKYMCEFAETMDEVKETMSKWRKRDESKKEGDWVMLAPEPPKKKNQSEQRYCWIVHPDKPGKGGPEVACKAARVALTLGRQFDIDPKADWNKGSDHRAEALGKTGTEWPVLKFPNGKTAIYKKPADSDEEEESDYVPQYHGIMTIIACRYKDEVYTADTLTDLPGVLHGRTKMIWTKDKEDLMQNLGIQASRHLKQMDEVKLAEGLKHFKAQAKINKQKI